MGSSIEIYYAAAVRSMSMSWHDFLYAAFDPAGTVSIDKLPGAFWVQALSVRIFGVHTWAIALPQVLEGSLTVLVLFRAVRRLAGPAAGLLAAGVLAFSPAVVTLDRGNISDTLLVLLLVLAADSAVAALQYGRWRSVGLAGLWVGLAFQAKMVEAWLVLPALAAVLLIASAGALRARLLRVLAMVVIAAAVSFSWMVFVTLTPGLATPVRRREPAQLGLRTGVRLQRLRPGGSAVAECGDGPDPRHRRFWPDPSPDLVGTGC